MKRYSNLLIVAEHYGLQVILDDWDHSKWLEAVRGHEGDKEHGERCSLCFRFNLERTAEKAAELGIEDLLERWPHELSGGQRQRLALGRAMAADPDVLFMDEPFSALDAMRREQLQDVLAGIRARHGTSFVFVTHDIAEAVFLSTHILLLAVHPFRTLGLLENPAAQEPRDGARRDDPRFYETVRRVHAALARSRRGEAE